MKKFFDLDSPFIRCLNRITDMMILNIVFLLTCLPVITIGAAWTALSYVALKMARNEEAYIIKSYFGAMKRNFWQATMIWAGMLGMGVVLFLDFHMMSQTGGQAAEVVRRLLIGICLIFFILALYVFPMLARFDNTIRATLNNALIMALQHVPCTLLLAGITGGSAVLTLISNVTFVYGMPFWILVGFALVACVNASFLRKVFEPYEDAKPCDGNS